MAGGGVWALEVVAASAMVIASSGRCWRMVSALSAHRQAQAGNLELLVHAGDLAARARRGALVHFARAVRRVVASVAVGVGGAEFSAGKHGARGQFQDVAV